MGFPPTAFLIGAQKAGTTTLAALLDQHPKIVLANPKEPDYFTLRWDAGLDWYRSCFPTSNGVLIDASVAYSMAPSTDWDTKREHEVPRRIQRLSPNAKFIYIVRDPAERCYSAYWHEVRARSETRSLRETVTQRAYFTMASYYFLQIGRYLPYFPLERFLILRFDDLVASPEAVARQCAEFLDVPCDSYPFALERTINRGFRYSVAANSLRKFLGAEAFDDLAKFGNDFLPARVRTVVRRLVIKDPPALSDQDRAWLYANFEQDMVAFEKLTGIRLTPND